jgi:hypothetical protein
VAQVGPVYETGTLARVLGCPVDQVTVLVVQGRLVGLVTSDGVTVYPAFQILNGRPREDLAPVLRRWNQFFNLLDIIRDEVATSPITHHEAETILYMMTCGSNDARGNGRRRSA